MLYIQSILVYTLLAFGMYFGAKMANRQNQYQLLWSAIPILLFTIVFGLRYGVGMDYNNYLKIYENDLANMSFSQMLTSSRLEFGFLLVVAFCKFLGLPTYMFFTVMAFIQIILIYEALKKEKQALPYIYLTFILTGIAIYSFMNVMRQCVSFCFFLISLRYIRDNKLWKYFICCLLALSFHKSALILFPLYFIWIKKKGIFHHPKIETVLLIAFFAASFIQPLQQLLQLFDKLIILLGYENYIDIAINMRVNNRIGITRIVGIVMNVIIIWNSKRIKDYYKNDLLNIIYDIYFIGTCFGYLFLGSMMFSRINLYFANIAFVMQAYVWLYYKQTCKQTWGQMLRYMYVLLFVFVTYSNLIFNVTRSTNAFVFYFQTELHQEKDRIRQQSLDNMP